MEVNCSPSTTLCTSPPSDFFSPENPPYAFWFLTLQISSNCLDKCRIICVLLEEHSNDRTPHTWCKHAGPPAGSMSAALPLIPFSSNRAVATVSSAFAPPDDQKAHTTETLLVANTHRRQLSQPTSRKSQSAVCQTRDLDTICHML